MIVHQIFADNLVPQIVLTIFVKGNSITPVVQDKTWKPFLFIYLTYYFQSNPLLNTWLNLTMSYHLHFYHLSLSHPYHPS